MIDVQKLTVKYGGVVALDDVCLHLKDDVIGLIGPNGAGKSELVLGVAGMMAAKGKVHMGETDLSGSDPQTIRAAGVAAVPEGHQTLAGISVIDNLRAAGPHLTDADLMEQIGYAREVFPELNELLDRPAGLLSGGQQQMVSIAQALVSRPKVLLVDEMSLGLAPVVIERLVEVVRKLRDSGIGILLIEQFTQLALDVADRCHVLSQGRLQFSGAPAELQKDRTVLERAYLG